MLIVCSCGFRGGYLDMLNFSDFGVSTLKNLKNIELCSNTVGQLTVGLLVRPPKKGAESDEIVKRHDKEKLKIFNRLMEKAGLVSERLNKMKNMSCSPIEVIFYI
jgi:alanine transaminase